MERTDVIVVGAGISGLLAARELHRSGRRVIVLEKSRGVGGRMATRRIGKAVFDHGAQFFTVRDAAFRSVVGELESGGAVCPWFSRKRDDDEEPHYRGVPGMTAPAKFLARNLDVRCESWVEHVRRADAHEGVVVGLRGGGQIEGRQVVFTSPVPQSIACCEAGGLDMPGGARCALEKIEYDPCFALMAILPGGGPDLPEEGCLQLSDGPISWIADNRRKGVSPHATAVTIHAAAGFTIEHFETPPKRVTELLLDAAQPWLRGAAVGEASLQRWRYSKPRFLHGERCLGAEDFPVIFCGDAFGGPRVEGAALSGLAAAEYLLSSTSLR